MTNLLIAPARQSGCQDLEAFANVVQAAAEQQRSPIDDILDSGVVEEELYLSALAQQSRMEWVTSIADFENIGALRAVCGPRVALAHRLLPMQLEGAEGEDGEQRLVLLTYDPLNLLAKQAATQQISLPIVWKMASRRRIHEALRKLYGVGADTFDIKAKMAGSSSSGSPSRHLVTLIASRRINSPDDSNLCFCSSGICDKIS